MGTLGCNPDYVDSPSQLPAGCANARGKLFDNSTSTTWQPLSLNYTWGLQAEDYLGDEVSAYFGFDKIFAGYEPTGVNLSRNSTVAWFRDEAFAVGMFGLNYRPTNFSIPQDVLATQDSSPSLLTMLYEQNTIPALSYGYTAGAYYRGEYDIHSYGSLVLGGYDKLKFEPNSLVFPFGGDTSKDLLVGITAITVASFAQSASSVKIVVPRDLPNRTSSSSTASSVSASTVSTTQSTASSSTPSPTFTAPASFSSQNLLPNPGAYFIDSTTSQIWLPQDACAMFEKAFGLTYDANSGLYLLNDTQHDYLVSQNISITFNLATDPLDAGFPVVGITLPYAAFDLWVTWGYNITEPSRYFPIRQATNATQYTLGRAFLQEAYLYVDNTRQTFTVSQRAWPSGNPSSQIVPGPYSTLSGSMIAAIVVSVCVFVITVSLSVWLFLRRKRIAAQKRKEEQEAEAERRAREKEEAIVPDPYATPDGVIGELHAEKLETPELFGRLLPFNGQEVDGSHASELRYELGRGRGMEGIEGRHELEAPHGVSQAPSFVKENEVSESEGSRKSVDITVSQPTPTEGSTQGEAGSTTDPVSPESSDGSSRGLVEGEDPISPLSPHPTKLQNDRHLIYGFF